MKQCKQKGNMVTGMLVGVTVAVIALAGAYWFFGKLDPKYSNLEKNEEFIKSSSRLDVSGVETLSPKGANDPVVEFHPGSNIPGRISASSVLADEPEAIAQLESSPDPERAETPPPVSAGKNDAGTQTATGTNQTNTSKPPVKEPKAPVAKRDENIKPVAKRSYLQTGAFKNPQQAEAQKAQLALIGIKSEIQQIDRGGENGIFHRVRVGPFTDNNQLKKTRTTLSENNIKADVVVPN